jgi:hypothetical protein
LICCALPGLKKRGECPAKIHPVLKMVSGEGSIVFLSVKIKEAGPHAAETGPGIV